MFISLDGLLQLGDELSDEEDPFAEVSLLHDSKVLK